MIYKIILSKYYKYCNYYYSFCLTSIFIILVLYSYSFLFFIFIFINIFIHFNYYDDDDDVDAMCVPALGLVCKEESALKPPPRSQRTEQKERDSNTVGLSVRIIMRSVTVLLSLLVLVLVSVPVGGAPGCGPCDKAQCAALPEGGCGGGGVLLDACGCCSLCATVEGEPCGGRRATALRRCGAGLECVRGGADKKKASGVCVCKSDYQVCGSDGSTYSSGCSLKAASLAAQGQGKEPISLKNKGRCASAPVIVTPPGQVYNVSGSQVYLSCEAVGVPTPVLTWKKVVGVRKKMELLPGDRDNLAIQTRGGPEKHEVTGWVLISPLTKEEEGSYECHAANARGEASAVGAIHLVESIDDIVRTVTKEDEL
ncbi:insulin-like growth factor-binding protein 7 isoform X2 [Eleginops maclovinus]